MAVVTQVTRGVWYRYYKMKSALFYSKDTADEELMVVEGGWAQ